MNNSPFLLNMEDYKRPPEIQELALVIMSESLLNIDFFNET